MIASSAFPARLDALWMLTPQGRQLSQDEGHVENLRIIHSGSNKAQQCKQSLELKSHCLFPVITFATPSMIIRCDYNNGLHRQLQT